MKNRVDFYRLRVICSCFLFVVALIPASGQAVSTDTLKATKDSVAVSHDTTSHSRAAPVGADAVKAAVKKDTVKSAADSAVVQDTVKTESEFTGKKSDTSTVKPATQLIVSDSLDAGDSLKLDLTSKDTSTTPALIDLTAKVVNVHEFPDKLPAKQTWEHIVSLPGYIINAPFWVLNKGIEKTIYVIDENKIVPKIKRVLISHDETRVIMPAHESQIGSGVKITKKKLFSDSSLLIFGANQGFDPRRGVKLYLFDNPINRRMTYDITTEYRNLFDAKFFGLGPDSRVSGESEYLNTQVETELKLKIKPRPEIGIEIKGGHHYHNIEDGEDSESPVLSLYPELKTDDHGFVIDLNMFSTGLALAYNSLNPSGHPLTGYKATAAFDLFLEEGDGLYNFTRTKIDIKKYFHLFYDRSLMLRLNSTLMRSFNEGAIPFYYLSELGETGTVRGYDRGRFRDRDRVFATVEYRYPIWSPEYRVIEAVVFADAGQVTDNLFETYDWERMRYGYGFGIRAYSELNRVLSLELGFSDELFRVYFILN